VRLQIVRVPCVYIKMYVIFRLHAECEYSHCVK